MKKLDVGSTVFYRQRKWTVIAKNPQGVYHLIRDRRGNTIWVHPNHVMVLNNAPLV